MLPGTRRYGGARYSKERKEKKRKKQARGHVRIGTPTWKFNPFRRSMDPKGLHEKLDLDFFKYPTDSIPRLVQFMDALEHLKFDSAKFEFFKTRFK